ncbi:MAG: hypothetical protein PUC65_02475 [Clostridiales bacterium]|nr:hypothetical protein [Clostridiales bacterium]
MEKDIVVHMARLFQIIMKPFNDYLNKALEGFVMPQRLGVYDGELPKGEITKMSSSMYLYHYFDLRDGAFRNLSDCEPEEADKILNELRKKRPNAQATSRHKTYIEDRLHYEQIARNLFDSMGGKRTRFAPHYMVVEECPWLYSWFEQPGYVKIPIEEFDLATLSFTYGDMHPTFSPRVTDGKEYRKKLYLYEDILKLIEKYGLPQIWNGDGRFGPERYIEVQVWSDETIQKYK